MSKEKISPEDITRAHLQLNEFANSFELMYGKWNITMNLHLLRHIPMAVEYLGPLWSQSAFAFEANNGIIVKANTSTKDIVHQIAWKYSMRHTIDCENKNPVGFSLGRKEVVKIPSDEREIFEQKNLSIVGNSTIFKSVVVRGIKYTSTLMRDVSTIDYFVKLKSGEIGSVKYFTIFDLNLYALMNIYEILDCSKRSLHEIWNTRIHYVRTK